MAFKLNTYFIFIALLCCAYVFAINTELAPYFLLANLPLIFFTSRFVTAYTRFPQVLYISAYAIWVFNFPRAMFLMQHMEAFMYPTPKSITIQNHIDTLIELSLYSSVFLLSFFLFTRKLQFKVQQDEKDMFFQKRDLVLWFALGMMLLNSFLQVVMKVGVHGAETGLEFIKFLLPYEYMLPLGLVFMMYYKKSLSPLQRLLVLILIGLNVMGVFLQGSKGVLLSVAMYVTFIVLLRNPDVKIKLGNFLFIFLGIGMPLMISVLFMQVLRTQLQAHVQEIDYGKLLSFVFDNITEEKFLMGSLNSFTQRLGSYDGIMVTFLRESDSIDAVFSFQNIFSSYFGKLIPFVSTDGLSLGIGVSRYISNLPIDFKHAGAIGGFGTMRYVGGEFGLVLAFIIPMIWSLALIFLSRVVHSVSLQVLYIILWFGSIFLIVNSGNFDSILQSSTIELLHLLFYFLGLKVIWSVLIPMTKKNSLVEGRSE